MCVCSFVSKRRQIFALSSIIIVITWLQKKEKHCRFWVWKTRCIQSQERTIKIDWKRKFLLGQCVIVYARVNLLWRRAKRKRKWEWCEWNGNQSEAHAATESIKHCDHNNRVFCRILILLSIDIVWKLSERRRRREKFETEIE